MIAIARTDGWEARLDALLEAARFRPYELGTHDCFTLACAAVAAITGAGCPPVARYTTKREALAVIACWGTNFEDAFSAYFGCERRAPAYARRGDILAYADAQGEKHLAVCTGENGAALQAAGLVFLALGHAHCCWRIG